MLLYIPVAIRNSGPSLAKTHDFGIKLPSLLSSKYRPPRLGLVSYNYVPPSRRDVYKDLSLSQQSRS